MVCWCERTNIDEMGGMYDLIILEPMCGEVGVKTAEHVSELLRKDLRWAIAGKDIDEMGNCLGKLKKGEEGRSLPGTSLFRSFLKCLD